MSVKFGSIEGETVKVIGVEVDGKIKGGQEGPEIILGDIDGDQITIDGVEIPERATSVSLPRLYEEGFTVRGDRFEPATDEPDDEGFFRYEKVAPLEESP
jgi:hypothetical protein